jgi:Ca2+-binding RTX toxin-like protein
MAAGGGNDTYVVDNAGDVVNELSNGGTDTIQTTLNTYSLAPIANVEKLTFIGAGDFTGTGNGLNNALTGGSGNDTLDGGAGNDTIDGGTGADSMIGGVGNDTFIVDDAGDTISEAVGAGTDTVKTILASYTLGANVENLTFTGAGDFTGTGNTLANTITGGTGNDSLDGGSNNDVLIGGAGADALTGGVGADKFAFTSLGDFASGPTLDTITDFSHAQADKIDLSRVDAIDNSIDGGANGTFVFISSAAFSGSGNASAGQLHYVVNGSGGVNVEGDTNGDGVADFALVVNGVASLAATDFVL